MASEEPGASAATWRNVAAIASLVRYMLTPVEATTAGRLASKPAADRLEIHRHQAQPLRDAEAEVDQALALPGLGTGLVDLEYLQPGGDLRPALGEGVQAGSEDRVLGDAAASLFHNQILDEASTGHDGGAERPGEVRVHVGAAVPVLVRSRQPQPNFVFEHVRRRVDLDVHRPPQGDPHRRAVWRRGSLIMHDVLFPFD
jgi:hypothetical protein